MDNADFVPKNEQGVVLFFSGVCDQMGFKVVSIQATYPDVTLYDLNRHTELRAEFEYHANNFVIHKHDPKDVDMIICWERGKKRFTVPILELSTFTTYPPNLYSSPVMEDVKPRPYYGPRSILRTLFVINRDPCVYIQERGDRSEVLISVLGDSGDHRHANCMEFQALSSDHSKYADTIRHIAAQAVKWGKHGELNPIESGKFVELMRKAYYDRYGNGNA